MSLWNFRLRAIFIHLTFLLIYLVVAAPAMFSPWNGLMVTLHNQSEAINPTSTALMGSFEGQPLSKRQCVFSYHSNGNDVFTCDANKPLVSEMVTQMRQGAYFGTSTVLRGALPGHPPFFYSNVPNTNAPTAAALGRVWLAWFIEKTGITDFGSMSYDIYNAIPINWIAASVRRIRNYQELWLPGDPDGSRTFDAFNDCYCQAVAAAAQAPFALLGIGDGLTWLPDSTWIAVEYPALTQNPNIQKIYRVDPRPNCKVEGPKVIWERGVDPVLPILRPCSWTTKLHPTDSVVTITIT